MCEINQFMGVQLRLQGHVMHLDSHVMHMTRGNIILVHKWLHGLVPSLKCNYKHNTLTFDAHGAHILLMGEQDVEIASLGNNDEINNLVFCYLVPPSLSTDVCLNDMSRDTSKNEASSCEIKCFFNIRIIFSIPTKPK